MKYGQPGELPLALAWSLLPALEPGEQPPAPLHDLRAGQPFLDRRLLELDEDPLAAVLHRRQPGQLAGQRGGDHAHLQLALDVGRAGLEAREAELGHHLAQPVDQDDALDGRHPGPVPGRLRQGAGEEVAVGRVLADLVLGRRQHLELGLLDRLDRRPRPQPLAGLDLREHLLVG